MQLKTSLISKAGAARRLDIDRRTLSRIMEAEGIEPALRLHDAQYFDPSILPALRRRLKAR